MSEYFQNYFKKIHFDKQLSKLVKKLKNKKIIIYGTGTFFQYLNSNYDLSKLNIIGVSDMKYTKDENAFDFGYKTISKNEIKSYNPDYVLIAVENYINLIENFELEFKHTKIKFLPLAKENIIDVIKIVWNKQ